MGSHFFSLIVCGGVSLFCGAVVVALGGCGLLRSVLRWHERYLSFSLFEVFKALMSRLWFRFFFSFYG